MSDLREALLRARKNMVASTMATRSRAGESEHSRGWTNAYDNVIGELDQILADHPPETNRVEARDNVETRAMRSAIAWYVQFLERERDNASG